MAPEAVVIDPHAQVAVFECGWRLRRIPLDSEGRDESGWHWGCHPDGGLWGCGSADWSETVTVRARDLAEAIAKLLAHGMPPRTLGKIGWSALR